MTLLLDRLLVVPVIPDHSGAVIIPEAFRQSGNQQFWQVLQAGLGRRDRNGLRIPMEANPGDRVITHNNLMNAVKLPDGTSIISERDVLMVIPKA